MKNIKVEFTDAAKNGVIGVIVLENQEEKLAKQYNITFKGKNNNCQVVNATSEKTLIFASAGKKEAYNAEVLKKTVAKITAAATNYNAKELTIDASAVENSIAALIEGVALSQYTFLKYKSQPDGEKTQISVLKIIANGNKKEMEQEAKTTLAIVNAVNYTRDIANEPGNVATPNYLANIAKNVGKESNNVNVTVLDKKKLEELKCNALLGVAAGSVQPPVMVVMEYKPAKYNKTIALVGKGITFDSGGISLKPGKDMDQMKFDKSGACAVIGAIKAISELQLPINVVGVFAATENLPSGSALKPGDIITAYNGKTIEILNTDAEGRLILADALAYTVKNYKPDYVIDIATLTGACVTALGNTISGLISNNVQLSKMVFKAGEETGDRCWELPIYLEHEEKVKSEVADVRNIGVPEGAGTITAAAFLKQFVDKTQWAHLDVAGTAWATTNRDYYGKGATGVGVRLFVKLCSNLCK
ncbi:MAG: leucyl aminopeptidase [Candidatus Micrarchaeota archaeon]